jgi:hypothetical protein
MQPRELHGLLQSLAAVQLAKLLLAPLALCLLGLLCGGLFTAGAVGAVLWSDGQWQAPLAAVVEAPPDRVDPALEGALVRVVGEATVASPAEDPQLHVGQEGAVGLVRVVETWQWIERFEYRRVGIGGQQRRYAVYHQAWSEGLHDSRRFEDPEGHVNPTEVPLRSAVVIGPGARVGAYGLAPGVLEALHEDAPLDDVVLQEADAAAAGGRLVDGRIHLHPEPLQPQIGDQRVRYRALPRQQLTVMGMQEAGQLVPWPNPPHAPVMLAQLGDVGVGELVWARRQQAMVAGGMGALLGGVLCAGGGAPLLVGAGVALLLRRAWRRSSPPGTPPGPLPG